MIALLQSGDLDYAFEYESVVKQHGLEYLTLPDEVNLSSQELSDFYDDVEVRLDFQRFATVEPRFFGEPIEYAITIPSSSPQPTAAQLFIQFLLSEEGRAIMQTNYHPLLDTYSADGFDNLPEDLKGLAIPQE